MSKKNSLQKNCFCNYSSFCMHFDRSFKNTGYYDNSGCRIRSFFATQNQNRY
ncbi:MAG: hypothetical protein NC485_13100 [Ruminococcus flavefaciens]|nr:hypothetical protein [Ruminococcus flavefaciens]MCM1062546.1 hypothetical protein [Eubacterium sp.]